MESARDKIAFVATDGLGARGKSEDEEYEGIPCDFCQTPSRFRILDGETFLP